MSLHAVDRSRIAVDIRFDAAQRLIEMRQGEILLDGASDPRPLRIHTPQGLIESRGGRLTVRILAMLPKALPVEVHSLTRYWVKVHPRATG